MSVCMYVRMYVRMYVCVCMYVRMSVVVNLCIYLCMYVVYVCMRNTVIEPSGGPMVTKTGHMKPQNGFVEPPGGGQDLCSFFVRRRKNGRSHPSHATHKTQMHARAATRPNSLPCLTTARRLAHRTLSCFVSCDTSETWPDVDVWACIPIRTQIPISSMKSAERLHTYTLSPDWIAKCG